MQKEQLNFVPFIHCNTTFLREIRIFFSYQLLASISEPVKEKGLFLSSEEVFMCLHVNLWFPLCILHLAKMTIAVAWPITSGIL